MIISRRIFGICNHVIMWVLTGARKKTEQTQDHHT